MQTDNKDIIKMSGEMQTNNKDIVKMSREMQTDNKDIKFFETKFKPYESFSINMNENGIVTSDKKIYAGMLLDISISNSVELLNKTLIPN